MHRGGAFVTDCILQEASIDLYWADFMRSIFIPSHPIFLSLPPSYVPFLFPLSDSLSLRLQNQCHGHPSRPLWGGQAGEATSGT